MAYYLVNGFWKLFSLLPLGMLYFLSDCIYYLLYYCIRYRRKVVRKNLVNSFPEKSLKEIITIDASNADALEELSDAGMLPLEGSGQKISLEKTVESLESQGWTVQE